MLTSRLNFLKTLLPGQCLNVADALGAFVTAQTKQIRTWNTETRILRIFQENPEYPPRLRQ